MSGATHSGPTLFGITAVVLGMAAFAIAFTARDFSRTKRSSSERKRMPGWVGRLWFIAWGCGCVLGGAWVLLHR